MKVFISGPMSGYEDYNCPAFLEAEKRLVSAGYSVFNPAWLLVDETWTRDDLMAIDISALSRCDAIYQIEGWEKSKGARVEYANALYTGKKFVTDEDILFMGGIEAGYETGQSALMPAT